MPLIRARSEAPSLRWKSGNYYSQASSFGASAATTVATSANNMFAVPIYVPSGEAIDQIALNLSTLASAGKLCKLGLYTEGADGYPDAFLDGSADLPADATNLKTYALAAPQAGGRWLYGVFWTDGTPTVTAVSGVAVPMYGETSATTLTRNVAVFRSLAYGAFPASFGTISGFIANTPPLIALRAA